MLEKGLELAVQMITLRSLARTLGGGGLPLLARGQR